MPSTLESREPRTKITVLGMPYWYIIFNEIQDYKETKYITALASLRVHFGLSLCNPLKHIRLLYPI